MAVYEFGCFSLNVARRSLLRRGRPLRLPSKLLDILTVLVENNDRVVTKEELIETIWSPTIVEESNLTVAVSRIRTALGDDRQRPKYILTFPRNGYRFIAAVRSVPEFADIRVAVLPFRREYTQPHAEYLVEGLTESLISSLSTHPKLKVIPHRSVLRFKQKPVDPVRVASALGATSIIFGRIGLHGDEITISVQLFRGDSGAMVGGHQYHCKANDFPATQHDIIQQITKDLGFNAKNEAPRMRGQVTKSHDVYQLYLRGRFHWNKRSERHLKKSINYFKQAIHKDPSYGLAYVGLSDSYNMLGFYGMLPPTIAFTRAKAAAMRALKVEDSIAEAQASFGFATFHNDWDWNGAEQAFQRAIHYDPKCISARLYYGCHLSAAGRFDEAIQQYKTALEIDPLSLIANAALGYGYYFARRYDEAIAQCREAAEMEEHFEAAHIWLGWAYEQNGMLNDAIVEYQKAFNSSGGQPAVLASLGAAFALAGNKDEAERILQELEIKSTEVFVSPYHVACIYIALAETEKALEYLETAFRDRSSFLVNLQVDPKLDSLRSDPRFAELVARIVPAKLHIHTGEADESYRTGRSLWANHTREGLRSATKHFRRATEIDHNHVPAYAALVDCFLRLSTNYFRPANSGHFSKGGAIEKPSEEKHASLALQDAWDAEIVSRERRRASELNLGNPDAPQWHAAYIFSCSLYEDTLNKSSETCKGLEEDLNASRGLALTDSFRALSLAEEVQIACVVARGQVEVGNIDAAYLMLKRWYRLGEWPRLGGLSPQLSADLLLTTGLLAGRYASARLLVRGQKHAEALLNGAIGFFQQLGLQPRVAEARSELGRCYDREGMFDLARANFLTALEELSPEYPELISRTYLRLAFAEMKAGHLDEAVKRLDQASDIVTSSESSMADFYHIEMATTLGQLAIGDRSVKYFEQSCQHYQRALSNSQAVGHHRRKAILENNHGHLMLAFGKLQEAELALMRARELFTHFADPCPQLDETLARFHLEANHIQLAEETIVRSVLNLERAGEDAVLAESLRTQGQILCRLGRYPEGRRVLDRAYAIADRCNDSEGAGLAILLTVEELSRRLEYEERLELLSLLERLLGHSQLPCVEERVRRCLEFIPSKKEEVRKQIIRA